MPDIDVEVPFHSDGFTPGEWKDRMEQLQMLQLEQRRRHVHLEPLYYGLPDLLFPKGYFPGRFDRSKMKVLRKKLNYEESDEDYARRQNEALTRFVTTKMFIAKDEKLIQIHLTPQMCELLCDLFYGRVSKVILWANRGGGKSLLAALFIWIMVVYRKRSCINMGGAGNQARRVYDYTTQFWHNVPGLQQGMLIRDPLMERTELKNGTRLICATSKSTAIGEHIGMFVADEACTDRVGGDGALLRSLQGCLSEPEPIVFLLSTFHLPIGFFADMWDNAEKQGFTQYRWNCFDTMQKCEAGLETATEQDPEAITYCHQTCPLTWTEPKRNSSGEVVGEEFVGCCGKARHSTGWMTRESILEAQRINAGTRIFPVEHACIRPRREGTIYDPEMIDRCVTTTFNLILDRPLTVGIDWGLTECAIALIGEWRELDPEDSERFVEGVGLLDVRFLQGQTTAAVVEVIRDWQVKYCTDDIRVRADGSHPYSNHDLRHTWGFKVRGVTGDKGDMGKANVARWLGSGYLKILAGFDVFLEQLKNLRRDMVTGKQIKQNKADEEGDHGPDALRFALMDYDFVKWYKKSEQAAVDAQDEEKSAASTQRRDQHQTRGRKLPRASDSRSHSWRGHGMAGFLRM